MTTKIDFTDPQQIEAFKRKISDHDRSVLIESLQQDLDVPPPDNLKGKAQIINDRLDTVETIDRLNRILNTKPMPPLESAPSIDEVNVYEMPFLIDGWMPANRLTLFTGTGGVGKSYMALQQICGLALGVANHALKQYHGKLDELLKETDGAFRREPIKVVIASYEEDCMETWKRISRICDWLGWPDYEKLTGQIKFIDLKMFGPIWGVEADTHLAIRAKMLRIGEWLLEQCNVNEAQLLMLDPSAGVYGANENARESVREFCSYLNGWGQETECATLLIAHPSKSDDEHSGSTDWKGSARQLWTLTANSEGKDKEAKKWYQFSSTKQNYTVPQEAVYLRKIKSENNEWWTPIWEKCSKEESIEFYDGYHSTFTDIKRENTDDEGDQIEL